MFAIARINYVFSFDTMNNEKKYEFPQPAIASWPTAAYYDATEIENGRISFISNKLAALAMHCTHTNTRSAIALQSKRWNNYLMWILIFLHIRFVNCVYQSISSVCVCVY